MTNNEPSDAELEKMSQALIRYGAAVLADYWHFITQYSGRAIGADVIGVGEQTQKEVVASMFDAMVTAFNGKASKERIEQTNDRICRRHIEKVRGRR